MPSPGRSLANVQPPPNPATIGNSRATTHGAYSRRVYGPRAAEIAEATFAAHAHLDPARHGGTVCRYATIAARAEAVVYWLNSQTDPVFADSETGQTHRAYERLERWERQLSDLEHRLAITPMQEAKLGLTTIAAYDLASAMSAVPEARGND